MIYDIKCLPLIYLGRQGENLARTVEIDVGAMLEAYPGASIGLVFQRAGETELYIGATTLGGTVLSWPITAAVTANAGRGKIEVRAMLGDVLAKSVTAPTQVDVSLSGAGGTPPDPEDDWIDDVLQAASEAKQSAASAADSAQQAEQAVENAKDAAAAVEAARTEAVQAVQEAGQAASEAVSTEGTEAVQTIGQAAAGAVEQVQQAGAAQVQAIERAGDEKLQEIDTANAHAPQINADTGKWQTWDAASGTYVDTEANAEGPQGPKGEKGDTGSQGPQGVPGTAATITVGSVTESAPGGDASVTNSGTASAAVLDFVIPRGETGPTGATGATGPAGLGVPQPTADDAGKIPVVNASGTGYELGTPAPDVDDTLSIPGAPADAAAVGEAIEAISPEDESVGAKPWTSKHIVDMLCPPLEVSGNPVQCYPVAGYPLSVQASWEPRQEGEGDPSPENVRPIVGLDEVTVTLSGSAGTGTTATLALPETIYGGTVDAVTGGGVETYETVELDGTESISVIPTNTDGVVRYRFVDALLPGVTVPTTSAIAFVGACSHYPAKSMNDTYLKRPGASISTSGNLVIYDPNFANESDATAFKAYLAAQAAAGTPVTIAYKLATPTAFQATGAQSLPALPGTNTVYTDADAVRVEGRTDPLATVQALTARIAALEAAAEQQAQVNAALNTLGVDTTPDQITALRMLGVETEE